MKKFISNIVVCVALISVVFFGFANTDALASLKITTKPDSPELTENNIRASINKILGISELPSSAQINLFDDDEDGSVDIAFLRGVPEVYDLVILDRTRKVPADYIYESAGL